MEGPKVKINCRPRKGECWVGTEICLRGGPRAYSHPTSTRGIFKMNET